MTENEFVLKNEKKDYQPGRDLLSDLPLSIIHIILALVPIEDAIRTCVLSRQWRYICATLLQLDFNGSCESQDYKAIDRFEDYMENFITNALFHHKGRIHKFKMSVSFKFRSPDIDGWVLCLSRKGIRELILDMDYYGDSSWSHLHSSIYSCEKLTYLDLFCCALDPPPSTFKGFLFLRHLCLESIQLSSIGIESLLANSPLLEKLEISKSGSSELRISAPNLKYLFLIVGYIELSLCAPLLANLYVEVTYDDFTEPQKSSFCNYTNFLGSLTKLEMLRGDLYFAKYLSIGIEFCRHSLVFHHLRIIAIGHVNFEDIREISVVARLIIGAPNLCILQIKTNYSTGEDYALEAPRVSFRDFGCAPDFTFEKLKVVFIHSDCSLPAKIAFIKFLLECSPVLETMSLGIYGGIPTEERQNLMAELQGFGQASPNAKLVIK